MATYGFTISVENQTALQAMKQIEESLASMGMKAKVEVEKTETAFAGMGEKLKETFGGLKSMILGGLGIAALFEGFEFVKQSKEAFDKLEESAMKINAALTSTKGIAGESAEELEKMAKAQSGKVLFGRANIEDAQSMLLTFTQIRGEIYEKTLPAIEDFATRFKMDLPEAANMLGKALNDPLKGMTRLQRQGVVFNEAQRETIKNFMATGQVAKAQSVILHELQTEFGGLAEAMTKTDEGKIQMAKKGWTDIKLIVGELVSKLQVSLIPILNAIIKSLKGVIDFFKSTSESAMIFKDVMIAVSAAVAAYYSYVLLAAGATKLITIATWAWNAALAANPITWVIMLIVALAAAMMYCWDKFKGFREFMGGMWAGIIQAIKTVINHFINLGKIIKDVFTGNFKQALADGKAAMDDFAKGLTTGIVDAVKKGADEAGKSEFKFGNLISFKGSEQSGPSNKFGSGAAAGSAAKQSAINTSNLSGASGGLGQAKVINIKIDAMQKITGVTTKELKQHGQEAVDVMIRAINNLSENQGGVQ